MQIISSIKNFFQRKQQTASVGYIAPQPVGNLPFFQRLSIGQIAYITVLAVWVVIAALFYAPISSFVNERVLESFHPVAVTGKSYDLSQIDKEQFLQKSSTDYTYASSVQEYGIGSDVAVMDGRAAALKKYLRDVNSPLMPYAEMIVKEADGFGLDWRLVVAIAGIESRFCRITPANTNNCWGWKGGPGGTWQVFETYEVGIKVLTARLSLGYGTKLTPYDIEPAYCPPCAASGHNWARAVVQHMNQMSSYLEKSRVSQ